MIAMVYAVDYAEIRLPLPDAELAFIDLPSLNGKNKTSNPEVKLSGIFAGTKHIWEGTLVRMEGEIDPRSRMVHVVARVEDPYGIKSGNTQSPLYVGMFVNASIDGLTYENVFDLDRAALRGSNIVWVIDDENKLHLRKVNILRQEKGRVIVNGGLADGDKICLTALDAVIDGMEVRVEL